MSITAAIEMLTEEAMVTEELANLLAEVAGYSSPYKIDEDGSNAGDTPHHAESPHTRRP